MKQKRNFEEYITRDELENTYNYQRKVFNSKIEEINQIIDKIQECFSLRFGEDIGNNKYDKEIEEIKNKLKQTQLKNLSELEEIVKSIENTIDGKLNEFEFKNEKKIEEDRNATKEIIKNDIEEFYKDINKRIIQEEEYRNIKIKELNESVKYIEQRAKELKEDTEQYAKIFREEIRDIGKDGRSRTAIGKLQKTIQDMAEDKQEIEDFINSNVEEINNSLENLESDLKKDIDSKIEKLDYENTIQSLKYNVNNIKDVVIVNTKEQNKAIKELNQNIQNEIEELNYKNTINDLRGNLVKMQNQRDNDIQENRRMLEEVEYYFQNQIKENIENLNYEDTVQKVEYIENCIMHMKQANEQMQINNNDMTEQMQAVLSIVASLEDKFNKSGIDTLTEDVGKIIDRQIKFIQSKYEKLFEEKLKTFERNIKVHEQMLENKMLQGRIQTRKTTNNVPNQNYNIVAFQNKLNNPSNIYNKIQDTQIKQSAQSNIMYNEKQTYLQEAINKLKTQKDISAQIRNTLPRKNQILFDVDVDFEE